MKGFRNPLLGEPRPEYGTSDDPSSGIAPESWVVRLGHPSLPSHIAHHFPHQQSSSSLSASSSPTPFPPRPRFANKVSTTKYTPFTFLPKCLLSQFRRFANVYFLFQCVVMFVGEYSTLFATPLSPWSMLAVLCFVLGVVMLFELRDDVFRHKNDIATNTRLVSFLSATGNGEEQMMWRDVCVGDVLLLTNKESMPADMILLASSEREGIGYVETSNIDGETNLKLRFPASTMLAERLCEGLQEDDLNVLRERLFQLNARCSYDPPNKHINSFNGVFETQLIGAAPLSAANLLLRGSVVRNTRWVVGLVVYTGKNTKVMQNSRATPSKMSRIERVINEALHTVVLGQCVLVTAAAICKVVWTNQNINGNPQRLWYLYPSGTSANSYDLPDWMASWLTFFVLFNNFVPVNLYVIMEMCNLLQGYLINQDLQMYDPVTDTPARARTNNLCQELGQVEYVFSDKTGTLTENVMKFKRCSVGGVQYGKMEAARFNGAKDMQTALEQSSQHESCWDLLSKGDFSQAAMLEAFLTVLCVSHTVVVGDEDGAVKYQAESPDEAALVKGAKMAGFTFAQREGNKVLVDRGPEGHATKLAFEVLAVNAFTSTRKRMSTVVRCPSGHLVVLCKGADNVMFAKASKEPPKSVLQDHLTEFAVQGLRTLVIGCRVLSQETYTAWKTRYDAAALSLADRAGQLAAVAEDIEMDMTILGATAIEDKLQEGVPDTIRDLAEAGIKLWILTGDKTETALNIGYSCSLLHKGMTIVRVASTDREFLKNRLQALASATTDESKAVPDLERADKADAILDGIPEGVTLDQLALVITGPALAVVMDDKELKDLLATCSKHCGAVIACRVSPLQKAQIVRMVKTSVKPTPVTLAIGDGANDVGMIQEADVGIGISGKEGMQAVNGSDFAIAQFRFLCRLLLVHGRWNYRRMSKVVVYSFYKNFCITLTLFFFNFITAYSGTSLYEEMMYNGFNIFTMLPIISVGVLDQDVKASTALKYPALYMSGRLNLDLNTRVVTEAIIVAIIHSLVVFVWPLFALAGLDQSALGGLYVFGTSVFCCLFFAMQYRVMLITSTWTKVTLLVHFLSYLLFFAFLFLYSLMWSISPQFYFVPFILLRQGFFWAVLFGVPATTLAIDYVLNYIRREYSPNVIDIAMETDRKQPSHQRVAFRSIVQHINPRGLNRPTSAHMSQSIVLPIKKPLVDSGEYKDELHDPPSTSQTPLHPGFAFSYPDETRPQSFFGVLGKNGAAGGSFDEALLSRSPHSLAFRKRRRKQDNKQQNQPSESSFYQQTMLAWQPGLSPRRVVISLLFVAVFFVAVGLAVTDSSNRVVEAGVQYAGAPRPHTEHARGSTWSYQPCNTTTCTVKIMIPEAGMKAPVYVLYGLTEFYQNYLRYTLSLDTWQLMGYERDVDSLQQKCKVLVRHEGSARTMLPCGLQANSMFNDTFTPTNSSIVINDKNIAWKSDLETKYANPPDYPGVCNSSASCLSDIYPGIVKKSEGVLNEHFIVWMRLAASSNFRKLYGRIEVDLPGDSELELVIENNFPVESFDGSKSVLLNTESWMGGKNVFLGWAYVASGCLAFVWAVAIAFKQGCTPRKVDPALTAYANRDLSLSRKSEQ